MMLTISEAMSDPEIFGRALGDPDTWSTWRAILKAAFAEPLSPEERATFDQVAGGREPPSERVSELWVVAGRRGGKSRAAAMVATYAAGFLAPSVPLAPGEEGVIVSVGPSVRQAGKVHKYANGFIKSSPVLSASVEGETKDEIRLEGDIVIQTRAADKDTVRGDTVIAAVFEEVAFWRGEDSANPDTEIYNAIAPALLTTDGMIIGISSPYAQKGLLYDRYRAHFGKNSPRVLVVMAPTWVLNPKITRDHPLVAARYEEDAIAAAAEHGERWRDDVEDFLSREAVEACVAAGVAERPPVDGVRYVAFVDPSGGSRDSMTLAIGHDEGGVAVLDALREERPPFSPESVVEAFAAVLKAYGVSEVTGDRYGGEWPRERFSKAGISYRTAEKSKSGLYGDTLAAINGRRVSLLDDRRLVNQLCALERRTSRGAGRDTIDHPPGGRDDVANAVAGLVSLLTAKAAPGPYPFYMSVPGVGTLRTDPSTGELISERRFDPERDLGDEFRGANAFVGRDWRR